MFNAFLFQEPFKASDVFDDENEGGITVYVFKGQF